MKSLDDFTTGRWRDAPGAGGDSTLGIILGVVVGVVILVVVGTVVTYCWLRSRQSSGVLATKPATATSATACAASATTSAAISTTSAAEASPSSFCNQCGAQLPPNPSFCVQCGTKVS